MARTRTLLKNRPILRHGLPLLAGIAISLSAFVGGARSGTISQVPLFVALGGTEPNVLFLLDDSGSMMFEIMPDDYTYWTQDPGSVPFVFPRADSVYGPTDYTNNVATIADNQPYTAITRCPEFNAIYYNPSVTYKPWKRSDGSSYPNADPECALHNPENAGADAAHCRDLTANLANSSGTTNWLTCNSAGCSSTTTTLPKNNFWTATYFEYNSGDKWNWSSYTRHEIEPGTSSYSGEGRVNRSDCTAGTCSYAQEIQNFANWYSYYRSRILAARAGIGQAFLGLHDSARVGYGSINAPSTSVDGVSTESVIQGLRPFSASNRALFYDGLYSHPIPVQSTPLRRALDAAGHYYSRGDGEGPWADTPGTSSSLSSGCRQSYTVLMTDGYWSGEASNAADTADARANNDGTNGPTVTGPGSQTYTYSAESPFSDTMSNTLADVAMYYWKRDLIGALTNEVPTSTEDPAFWQHMVTYGVGLGVSGSVDPTTAYAAIGDTSTTINWPNPDAGSEFCSGSSCAARLDDLLHASLNSRGQFFSARNPEEFATGLSQILADIVARTSSSAAAVAANSTSVGTDTLIYQAKFDSSDWSGKLLAYALESDGSVHDPDADGNIEEDAEWDTSAPGKIPAHGSRTIYGLIGSDRVEMSWASLDPAQQTTLTGLGITEDILNWVRGDQSNEVPSGPLRARSSILGDIVNSSPTYLGALNFGYEALPTGTAGRDDYFAFKVANQTRTEMLYVGANDGMLHALDAETGVEKFAFIPNAALSNLASLSSPAYGHRYFVDGSAQAGDYFDSGWKTALVGSMGAGGRSVFALDVTNPDGFDELKILWEITDADLGYPINQLTQPVIGRMQNGDWAVVLSNGYESDNHRAVLFVVRLSDGHIIRKIDTGAGDASSPNGLAAPVLIADGNRTIKYAYAGDLLGNLWKFDLSSNVEGNWDVAFENASVPMPLFRARYVSGGTETAQPITAAPEIADHPDRGYIIYFGTGKFFEDGDDSKTDVQSLYGIWDKDDGSSSSYIAQTDRSSLQEQSILAERTINGKDWRFVSDNTITWTGGSAQRGWFMDLISPVSGAQGERVTSAPLLRNGRAIFTTMIPSANVCEAGGISWIMEMDMISGGRLDYSVFDVDGDGDFDMDDFDTLAGSDVPISGVSTSSDVGIINKPTVLECGDAECKMAAGSTGKIARVHESGGGSSGRQSWRQLR